MNIKNRVEKLEAKRLDQQIPVNRIIVDVGEDADKAEREYQENHPETMFLIVRKIVDPEINAVCHAMSIQ